MLGFTPQQIQALKQRGLNDSDILMMQLTGQGFDPNVRSSMPSTRIPMAQELLRTVRPEIDYIPRRPVTDPDELAVHGGISKELYEAKRRGIPAVGNLTARGIDLAVSQGYKPEIFENYGRQDPALDAQALQAHNTALTAAKNEIRAARGASTEIEPISMSDSSAALMNFLGNEYNDLATNVPYHYAAAKRTVAPALDYANENVVKPLRPRLSPYADAVRDPENTLEAGRLMAQDVKAGARKAYNKVKPVVVDAYNTAKPYVDEHIIEPLQPTMDIYKTLADDPEATARGVAMAAADARDYTEREAPNWVAQVSSSLNRGNKFLGSLKDAWRNPEHYLSGGTYDDRLRIQEARERPRPTQIRRPPVESPIAREQPTQGFSYSSNSQVTPPRPDTAVPASSKNKLQQSLPTQQVQ